jgi:hypothetical protein
MIWIKLHWGNDLDLRETGSIEHLETIPNPRLVKLVKVTCGTTARVTHPYTTELAWDDVARMVDTWES